MAGRGRPWSVSTTRRADELLAGLHRPTLGGAPRAVDLDAVARELRVRVRQAPASQAWRGLTRCEDGLPVVYLREELASESRAIHVRSRTRPRPGRAGPRPRLHASGGWVGPGTTVRRRRGSDVVADRRNAGPGPPRRVVDRRLPGNGRGVPRDPLRRRRPPPTCGAARPHVAIPDTGLRPATRRCGNATRSARRTPCRP